MFKKLITVVFLFCLTQNKKYFIYTPQEDQPPMITEEQPEFKKLTLFNFGDKTIDIIQTFGRVCYGAGIHYDSLDCSDYPLIKGVAKSSILDMLNTFHIKFPENIQRFLEKTTQLEYQMNAEDLTFSLTASYDIELKYLHENIQFNSLSVTFFHSSEDSNVEIDFRFILDGVDFSVAKWNNKTGFAADILVNFDKQINIGNTEMQFNFTACYSNNSTQCSTLPKMSGVVNGSISDIMVALGHKELNPEQFEIYNKNVQLFINYDSQTKQYNITSFNQLDTQIGKTDLTDGITFEDITFSLTGTGNDWHAVIKQQSMVGQKKIMIMVSSDDGLKIQEVMDDGTSHQIQIGELIIDLIQSESGLCQLTGISHQHLDCSQFPLVTFQSNSNIQDFIKKVGIDDVPFWMKIPLTYLPKFGMLLQLNFATLNYQVIMAFNFNCKLDVEFLRQFELENLEFNLSGVKKDYKMFVGLNSKIGETDLVVKWLPKNDTVKYEVDLGKISFGHMASNMIPPVEDSSSVLNDFDTLEMEETIMTVDPDIKNIKITSGLNMGTKLEIDLRLKKEGQSSAIRVDFKKLEFLRPSLISNNLKFLDDYTVQMHDFKASTYDEDKGLTMSGGFPMTNKIMKELVKIIPFRDDNGFMPFNMTAHNTENFKIEIFLLANKQYDGWALKDNALFFQSENGIFQGGVSQILEVQVDDDTVDFKSLMELSEYQFSISAFLSSPWLHPFNCNKLDIYEAGAQVGITFEPFFSFAVDGKFKLVDTQFNFAVRFDPADVRNNAFFAEIDDLNFTTLIKGIKDVEIPSPLDQFTDNFTLNQGKMSIAGPEGVTLMEKHYDGGVSIALNATMFGKNFGGELTWNETMLYLHGYSAPFVSEYFKFTAYQDKTKGPLLNMSIPFKADKKDDFAFLFDGEMQVLGVDIGAYSKIDKTGLVLVAKVDVQPYRIELFNFNLNVTLPNLANNEYNYDELGIHAQMLVPEDINERIANVTILLAKDINKAFYLAEDGVISAKIFLKQTKKEVSQSQNDLKAQLNKQSQQFSGEKDRQIINENDYFYRQKNIATNKMEAEKRRAKQQLDHAYSKCPKVVIIDVICKGLITAAMETYNAMVSSAEFTMQATMNDLAAAHQMKLKNINDLYDDAMRLAYAQYQTGVDATIQAIDEAQSLLDEANKGLEIARKECGKDIPIISEMIQKFPIKLQEITFDAQAKDLTLDLLIIAKMHQKLYKLSLDMNFKQSPDMILKSLAEQLWQNIKDNFISKNLLELNNQYEYISYLDNDDTEESFGRLESQQIIY